MNENAKFLFFCMIFVGKSAFAQNNTKNTLTVNELHITKPAFNKTPNAGLTIFNYKRPVLRSFPLTFNKPPAITSPVSYALISPNYYTQNFGFFCKRELQLEKVTKIPFKFRLGSVQQCDWMEGKPNAFKTF